MDFQRSPRLTFALDFLKDLALVAVFNLGVRTFLLFGVWLDRILPLGHSPASYLPLDHLSVTITVVYAVSAISITVSGAFTLLKVIIMQARTLR